jgi:phosphatidylserine decarboxylase
MRLHREGNAILVIALLILVGLNVLFHKFIPVQIVNYVLLLASAIFYGLIINFFRNPMRISPEGDDMVLSPADGKVVVIEETDESEFFNDRRIQISIFMSPLNVHVCRNPIGGAVKYFKYHPGKYLVAWHPKSSTENERTTMVLEDAKGSVLVRQIAGAVARRIRWYVKEGDQVQGGGEYGFIRFGSRLDVFLPIGTAIKVELNQKVVGGQTVLAAR